MKFSYLFINPVSWLRFWLQRCREWLCRHKWQLIPEPAPMEYGGGNVVSIRVSSVHDFRRDMMRTLAAFSNFKDEEGDGMFTRSEAYECPKCSKMELREAS